MPGESASPNELVSLFHRYHTALQYCENRAVLDVCCGAGQGLNYLAKAAKQIVGGDYCEAFLIEAAKSLAENACLVRLDSHLLPFADSSLDVVLLLEAIYYLDSVDRFLDESRRVLKKGGVLIICTWNPGHPGFTPSLLSKRYISIPELRHVLERKLFEVQILGAFPAFPEPLRMKLFSLVKRMGAAWGLIPTNRKAKLLLKRMFFQSVTFPRELRKGMVEYVPPVNISLEAPNSAYRTFYAIAFVL